MRATEAYGESKRRCRCDTIRSIDGHVIATRGEERTRRDETRLNEINRHVDVDEDEGVDTDGVVDVR